MSHFLPYDEISLVLSEAGRFRVRTPWLTLGGQCHADDEAKLMTVAAFLRGEREQGEAALALDWFFSRLGEFPLAYRTPRPLDAKDVWTEAALPAAHAGLLRWDSIKV